MSDLPGKKLFVPGQSGNPLGGKLHNKVKKKIRKLTLEQLEMILNKILLAHPDELSQVIKQNPLVLKTWIASIIQTSMKKGDASTLFILLERLVGKVTDKVSVTSVSRAEVQIIELPKNGFESPGT